jgi:hypothetical protein
MLATIKTFQIPNIPLTKRNDQQNIFMPKEQLAKSLLNY